MNIQDGETVPLYRSPKGGASWQVDSWIAVTPLANASILAGRRYRIMACYGDMNSPDIFGSLGLSPMPGDNTCEAIQSAMDLIKGSVLAHNKVAIACPTGATMSPLVAAGFLYWTRQAPSLPVAIGYVGKRVPEFDPNWMLVNDFQMALGVTDRERNERCARRSMQSM